MARDSNHVEVMHTMDARIQLVKAFEIDFRTTH